MKSSQQNWPKENVDAYFNFKIIKRKRALSNVVCRSSQCNLGSFILNGKDICCSAPSLHKVGHRGWQEAQSQTPITSTEMKKSKHLFQKNPDRLIPVTFESIGFSIQHWRFLITVLILTLSGGRVRLSCFQKLSAFSFHLIHTYIVTTHAGKPLHIRHLQRMADIKNKAKTSNAVRSWSRVNWTPNTPTLHCTRHITHSAHS